MVDKKAKFIEKAKNRHGDKYDYSKVEYINSTTKVCIICKEHGEFWQTPQGHVRGQGCPKCANIKRGDTFRSDGDTFVKRATVLHDGKYIYDKDSYINAMTKVPILCLKHGTFWMTPMNHLLGQGCPKCNGRGLNTEEIIELFKKKHGDSYDYSKVVFTKMHEKVCIICKKHGEFWQTPSKHLLGQGCHKYGIEKRTEEKNIGQEEFIRRCKSIYGTNYIYDETEYTKMENKVKIICPKHGEQLINYYNLLNGQGCYHCGRETTAFKNTITNEEFIKRGKEIFGDEYTYEHLDMYNRDEEGKVIVTCKKHGNFKITPDNFFHSVGCPICAESNLEGEMRRFLEENKIKFESYKKFEWLGKQHIDFYLPEYDVGIECQGGQHFKPVGIFGGEDAFIKTISLDIKKRKLCKENGVKLFYYTSNKYTFPYKVFTKKNKLLEEIKGG